MARTEEQKEQHRLYMVKYRAENREKVIQSSRASYQKHKDKRNAKKRELNKLDPSLREKRKKYEQAYKESGRRKEVHLKNPNRKEVLKRVWQRVKNNPKRIEYTKKYREKVLIQKERKAREELSDSYIVAIIKKRVGYKIKTSEIPKELIELKRNQIKIKRLTKNNENEQQ